MNKRVTSPIVGFSKVERIEEALHGRGLGLMEEEEKYLEEPYVVRQMQGYVKDLSCELEAQEARFWEDEKGYRDFLLAQSSRIVELTNSGFVVIDIGIVRAK